MIDAPKPKVHLIPVDEGELATLIRDCKFVELAFGVGGCALKWTDGTPMPEAVERLGLMRGVMNENMDGAGI
jgi:hypothetical protein